MTCMRRLIAATLAAFVLAGTLLAAIAAQATPRPAPFTVGWAVVNVDGTLARGSGAVSATAVGTDGIYFVRFNRDVSGCAYVGAGGEATTFPPDDAIVIGASAGDRGDPNEVSVIEYDAILARDSYSSGFHLIVTC
jgi:hypothetical protein